MTCSNCGSELSASSGFCIKCGARVPDAPGGAAPPQQPYVQQQPYDPNQPAPYGYGQPPQPYQDPTLKSKMIAGVLGILLGAFGVHRLYLEYKNIGIIQCAIGVISMIAIPFTCGLSAFVLMGMSIWGLVEGIMILIGNINVDGVGRPLRD